MRSLARAFLAQRPARKRASERESGEIKGMHLARTARDDTSVPLYMCVRVCPRGNCALGVPLYARVFFFILSERTLVNAPFPTCVCVMCMCRVKGGIAEEGKKGEPVRKYDGENFFMQKWTWEKMPALRRDRRGREREGEHARITAHVRKDQRARDLIDRRFVYNGEKSDTRERLLRDRLYTLCARRSIYSLSGNRRRFFLAYRMQTECELERFWKFAFFEVLTGKKRAYRACVEL